MNDLLFYTLIIALLYYFFLYLPQPKEITNPLLTKPLTHSQFTQTDSIKDSPELAELKSKNQALIKENKDYQSQITSLQTQIRDLAKRPLKPTNSKSTQTDNQDLESTLDTLIKDIQDLNKSL